MPDWVVTMRRNLNPATNPTSNYDAWVSPFKQWRNLEAKALEKDIKFLRMLVLMPPSFTALRLFTCTVDKKPPADIEPPPVSMPVDMNLVLKIGLALEEKPGFCVRIWEDGEDRCFMSCDKDYEPYPRVS